MGNCIDHQRVSSWVDDEEWELMEGSSDPSRKKTSRGRKKKMDEELHAPEHEGSSAASSTVIKVKLTKRQLEELLQRANARGAMDVRRILEHAIDVGAISGDQGGRRRRWTPRLEVINEVAEDAGEL